MTNSTTSGQFSVLPDGDGERLDRYLAQRLDQPRSQVQRWIRDRRVRVNEAIGKASQSLQTGDRIDWEATPVPPEHLVPEEGPLPILFEDSALLVVDKPAGLTVHPGAGRPTGTLVHRLLAHAPEVSGVGGRGRPGVVHRLDKDTSGVMVLARTERAYQELSRAFAERRVRKVYEALVYGPVPGDRWTIDAPIGRHSQERTRMQVRRDGRPAVSHFEVQAKIDRLVWVRVRIETGRTHQIRVHAKHGGTPLVGDPMYGEARWKGLPPPFRPLLRAFSRPALHAVELAFAHPLTGEEMTFRAPRPPDLARLWEDLSQAASFA